MTDAETARPVLSEIREGGIALVRLNRPEALNALNMETRRLLAETFAELSEREEVRVIVITGDDKAFAAGADLKEFVDEGPVEIAKRRSERYWAAVSGAPQPVIAAIRGFALGGGLELAMQADLIVVGEGAQLGQPEIRVGIMPGAGGTQRLTRAVGKFVAMRMCLTGKPISGEEAYRFGLACDLVPDEEVLDTALKLAEGIARMPPMAARAIKDTVLAGADMSLESALALERRAFQTLFATRDKLEGMTAFIEKRKPTFTGE